MKQNVNVIGGVINHPSLMRDAYFVDVSEDSHFGKQNLERNLAQYKHLLNQTTITDWFYTPVPRNSLLYTSQYKHILGVEVHVFTGDNDRRFVDKVILIRALSSEPILVLSCGNTYPLYSVSFIDSDGSNLSYNAYMSKYWPSENVRLLSQTY